MGGAHEVYDQYITKDGIRFALLEIGSTKHMEGAYKKLLVVMCAFVVLKMIVFSLYHQIY